jgi:mRNA interferase RelE/StbE
MQIQLKSSARKNLIKIDQQTRKRIADKIDSLAENPLPQGVEKLSNDESYRVRVGDYRIVFTVNHKDKIVGIIKIGHRRDIYKQLS